MDERFAHRLWERYATSVNADTERLRWDAADYRDAALTHFAGDHEAAGILRDAAARMEAAAMLIEWHEGERR